jgi:hypothetical protein
MMKRAILNTNIYGNMIIGEKIELFKNRLNQFIIYGNKIIKNELRNAPKKREIYSKNLRMSLLKIHDNLVKNDLKITKEGIETAENYYRIYKELKNNIKHKKIIKNIGRDEPCHCGSGKKCCIGKINNHKVYISAKENNCNLSPRYDFFGRNAGLPILKSSSGGLL